MENEKWGLDHDMGCVQALVHINTVYAGKVKV